MQEKGTTSETEMQEKGTYLYAVVGGLSDTDWGSIGIGESKVYTIPNESGDLIAVVSDVPTREEMRPERRNLAAHQRVLKQAIETSRVVLPVSFGTIAENPDGILTLLDRYREDLIGQMQRVEGKTQMSARLYYKADKPSVFEFFVQQSPALAQARDRLLATGSADRDAKINLGQTFEAVLNDAREEYAGQLRDALASCCAETKLNKPRNEQEMVRLACLLEKGRESEFESALEKVADALPDPFTIEQLGPFPPYDFIELHLTV